MIIRVFRAQIREGKQEEFRKFFLNKALPRVRSQPGLVSAMVGTPLEISPNEFVMVMVWESVEAIKKFTGSEWYEARIDPEEVDLLSKPIVHHYEMAST